MTSHAESREAGPTWELYSHGADIGIRGTGATLAEAFAGIGLALNAVVCDLEHVFANSHVNIHCDAEDPEHLLYAWVNALIFEMVTRPMLFSRFRVSIVGPHLAAEAWGEPLDIQRHEPAVEIKGATYTDLKVTESEGRWMAQCIVDV